MLWWLSMVALAGGPTGLHFGGGLQGHGGAADGLGSGGTGMNLWLGTLEAHHGIAVLPYFGVDIGAEAQMHGSVTGQYTWETKRPRRGHFYTGPGLGMEAGFGSVGPTALWEAGWHHFEPGRKTLFGRSAPVAIRVGIFGQGTLPVGPARTASAVGRVGLRLTAVARVGGRVPEGQASAPSVEARRRGRSAPEDPKKPKKGKKGDHGGPLLDLPDWELPDELENQPIRKKPKSDEGDDEAPGEDGRLLGPGGGEPSDDPPKKKPRKKKRKKK